MRQSVPDWASSEGMRMKKMKLLAPAGGMEQLQMALHFGADEVYLAGHEWGMRAQIGERR